MVSCFRRNDGVWNVTLLIKATFSAQPLRTSCRWRTASIWEFPRHIQSEAYFNPLISDHVELKALYGVAPGHRLLKHVLPTGGTHVAPSRNRKSIGGRHVFLISKKGLLFALWFPAFAGMTECGCYVIHKSNLSAQPLRNRLQGTGTIRVIL